ncbi:TonB-dependent receptor [Psychrobium sp. 1_MG-2023]|uniref:TonB-dependent receptor n=1 Tax=Psychrobium sp. 1_MG-2023 TaxID=3062624 RepID=UPI000C33EA2B|nr:TonB-dependent receptor [Psychrobium sp. 1_MG-2023]MDP2562127.1 TonB-dependent receptor [Psychrobium sp. 1_MG-2023]PKF57196.1 TonB-dependent receptor [Alteromonadales bacterium alter-6D02]
MTRMSLVALSISSLMLPTTLIAEQLAAQVEKSQQEIERITISASRIAKKDIEQAIAVEFVGKSVLDQDNGQHISESLNTVSGVMLNQLQGGHGHNAAIRMPINYSGYYLYLQDNIPLQSAAFFNHNALWWSSFNSTIKRIEVIKGAGTSLHGSGAIAATINTLSEDVTMTPSGHIGLTLGEYGYAKAKAYYSNAIDESQGIAISGSLQTNEGYRDHTASERGEIHVKHKYILGDDETLTTSFVASDLEQEMATSLLIDDFENNPKSSGLTDQVLASDPLRNSKYYRLSTTWEKITQDDYRVSLVPYLRQRTNDYTATWNNNMPKQESTVTTLGLLAYLSFEPSDEGELIVGLDVERSKGESLSYQPQTITTTGWGGNTFIAGHQFYDDETTYTGISPYFQYQHELTDQLTVAFGGRYDYNNYDFDNFLAPLADDGYGKRRLADREDSFNHFSPKMSLNYLLDEQSSVYARYANSFRIPTAGSLYHISSGSTDSLIGGVDVETSDTYELGYKINHDVFNAQVAMYYMDLDDALVRAYNEEGFAYQTNAGRVIHKGIEFSINSQVTNDLEVSLALSKSVHEYDEYIIDAGRVDRNGNSKEVDNSGNKLKLAPEHIANLRLVYTPQVLSEFTGVIEVKSMGDYYMDDQNTKMYGGTTTANLKFNYQLSDKLRLHGRVTNLTDKYYAQQASISYGKEKYAPAAGRRFYTGLSYSF